MFWLFLAQVGLVILSYVLQRRAATKIGPPGEIQPQEVPAGTPIPVAFGMVKLEPIITEFSFEARQWGNLTADGPSTLIPGQKTQYGFRYVVTYLGLLAWGPLYRWHDIVFDEKKKLSDQGTQYLTVIIVHPPNFYGNAPPPTMTVTPTSAVTYGDIYTTDYIEIYLPNIFGGRLQGGEGGIQRYFDVFPPEEPCLGRAPYGGSYSLMKGTVVTQIPNADPQQAAMDDRRYFGHPHLDEDCNPIYTTSGTGRIRYPHYAYVYLHGVEVGTSPVLKKQEHVVVSAIGVLHASLDANPVSVLTMLLTDQEWGLGISEALIDTTGTFAEAATYLGDALGGENFGISGVLREQRPAEEYIEEILRTIDATLYRHPETGKLCILMIRRFYFTIGSLPALDESNVEDCEWSRRDVADTINTIHVAYIDRARLWNRNIVTVQDHANIQATGSVRSQVFEFPFISNETDALRVAARELKSNTLPLGSGTLLVNRDLWDAVPGDVFRLSWARYGIADLPVRIVSIDSGNLDDGMIEVSVVEDVYGLPEVPYTVTTDPWDDPSGTQVLVPTVIATKQDDGVTGIATLSILDDGPVTLVEFATQSGRDAMSSYSTATGGPQYTSQPVNLSATDMSFIYWRVTYTDAGGNDVTLTGIVSFGSSPSAAASETGALFDDDGNIISDDDGNTIFAG